MDSLDEDRPPRKKARRAKAKRKPSDPAYKPANGNSDSDSGFDSEPSVASLRRHNPRRNSTVGTNGGRINYSEARTADPFTRKKAATVGASRKRKTRDGDKENGSSDIPKTEQYESLSADAASAINNEKPVSEGKTTWFFSRMIQGMKNFWGTTVNNNNMEEPKKSSDSNKETEAYGANASASGAGNSLYFH